MSLMRLLAVGSSIRGIKDRPSPYKMTQQHLLPKFGGSKAGETKSAATVEPDPCSGAGKQGPSATATAAHNERTQMQIAEQDVKQANGPTDSTSPSPSAESGRGPSLEQSFASAPVVADQIPSKRNTTISRTKTESRISLMAFWRWGGRSNPFHPKAVLQKGAAPIQGELSLQEIKVVRNDLNETDLEVVPALKNEVALPATETHLEASRLVLRRIAARLFGARPSSKL